MRLHHDGNDAVAAHPIAPFTIGKLLALEYGSTAKARAATEGTSVVRELTQYCRNTIQC